MRARKAFASALVGPALAAAVLTGCSNDDSTANPSETATDVATDAKATVSDINKLQVSAKPGSSMAVTYDGVFGTKTFSRKVLTKGSGAAAAVGNVVEVRYSAVNGRNKKVVDETKNNTPATFALSKSQLTGLTDTLKGLPAGSRVLSVVPPAKLFSTKGNEAGTITGTDTVIFVMDVLGVKPARATGTKVAPKAGLPTVQLAANGSPTISVPKTKAPTKLVSQNLIQGNGAAVKSTDTVFAQYRGVIWATGKEFDSSWKRGEPTSFSLDGVIPGWTKGLTGKKVGSQVLLVVPPADGYGAEGRPDGGIKGTDTLVFVVDILATSPGA